jgi:colanic acid/amylovoran biosynthesis glycosyltransferase
VFATQHGGIPEVIENGVSGVLVPERHHENLAALLLDAVQDPGLLSRIALNGAEIVRKNFDLHVQAQRLDDTYLRIIGRGD